MGILAFLFDINMIILSYNDKIIKFSEKVSMPKTLIYQIWSILVKIISTLTARVLKMDCFLS